MAEYKLFENQKDYHKVKNFRSEEKRREFINACINLQKSGVTKEELAKLSNVSRQTISNWLKEFGFTSTRKETSTRRGYYKRSEVE